MNPFRHNPEPGLTSVLLKRKEFLKNSKGKYFEAATRNPAYIKVTGKGNGCIGSAKVTLPYDEETFESTYAPKNRFKLKPILEEVIIESGGEFGLTQTISITIKCFDKEDFKLIEKAFLLPGNEISATFGYGKSRNPSDQKAITIKDYRVATYNFNATSEGYWIAQCKAIAPAEALKDIEISSIIKDKNLKYRGGQSKKFPVKGMAELIAYDAQKNGELSIDKLKNGETITPAGVAGSLVVYHSDHLFATAVGSWINTMVNKFDSKNEAEQTHNVVYVTLEYIVKRLIMNQIVAELSSGILQEDSGAFKKLDIVFDKNMSVSWVSKYIRSGSPITCLLLGLKRGNYKNTSGEGKDFEEDVNMSQVQSVMAIEGDRQKILHKNILIERATVMKFFNEASKKEESTSDSTDVKDTKENVLPIEDFLKKIFNHIGICTGGSIQLRLVVHPKDKNKLVIVDQNNGKINESLQVVVFDPINGDGSTRSCTINSNVGAEEYKAYMFAGTSKKGDGATNVRGCKEKLDKKRENTTYKDALKAMQEIILSPGSLAANQFGAVQENALIQAMGTIAKGVPESEKFEMIAYMGLGIDIEIDGVYGFTPGCAISSKQLPEHYFTNKNYFQVKTVTHTFTSNGSDWSTKLSGFMTFYKKLNWISL